MDNLNIPTDVFDPDDIESPLDPISEPIRVTPRHGYNLDEERRPEQHDAPQRAAASTSGTHHSPAAKKRMQAGPQPAATRREPQRHAQADVEPLDFSVDLSFFTDGRFSKLVGIALLFTALFCLIVSISFFSTGGADQSALGVEGANVDNPGGFMGAIVANAFISEWLGVGSFLVIFLIGALGASLVRLHRFNIVGLTIKTLISAIAVSVIAGYVSLHLESHFSLGGNHGHFINTIVRGSFGEFGTLLLSLLLLAMLAVIFLKEVTACAVKMVKAYKAFRRKVAAENLARQERQDQARRDAEMRSAAAAAAPVSANAPAAAIEPQAEDVSSGVIAATPGKNDESVTDAPIVNDEPHRGSATLGDDTLETYIATVPEDENAAKANATKPLVIEDLPVAEPLETEVTTSAEQVIVRTAPEIATVDTDTVVRDTYDPTAELSHYRLPSLDVLNDIAVRERTVDLEEQEENKQRITATLNSFGIGISRIEATIGPTVTLYEIVPAEGIRISKIKNLEDDIARSIAAIGTRIIAPIPGKETVGIEVPNKDPQIVPIKTILSSEAYQKCNMRLPMAIGATIANEVFIADLTKMPHLLVAGATGMGKSVGLNTIIASLLYKKHPAELKFVLVDPKMVEFSLYRTLERHYLAKLPDEEEPIITDPSKVVPTLNSLCVEMDNRYNLLKLAGVRQITEYNQKFIDRRLNPNDGHEYLPYIVVIVDEFADLIITAGKEVEQPISRIAAKARAVGIHLILATQRPSTNVITGLIKANFPGRIAFRVFQMVDSRTILDHPGANQLIGRGDMLFSRDGVVDRVQCALIETEEVERLCAAISSQQGYAEAYELPEFVPEGNDMSGRGGSLNDTDPLFSDAARYVSSSNQASTTSLQRHFEIGYPRAGKIMDQLEKAGIVGPAQGSKPRSVLMDLMGVESLLESMNLR